MATKVDQLIIEIKAETKKLRKGLDEVNTKLGKTGKSTATATKGFGGMAAAGGKLKGILMAVAVAIGVVVATVKKIAAVGMAFEDLKDSLNVVFGSMRKGDAAMQNVLKFAQTTPFQVEDATKAFIALRSAGIEPSMTMLQTFADTASVSVDQLGTFEALIRMVQRSASGGMGLEELNMISDRGIDVLGILKEKLGLTKDDIAVFGKTAEGAAEMVKALTDGLQEKFGGAMEQKMDNLSVKASNMGIAFKQVADEIYQAGLDTLLKGIADDFAEIATQIANTLRIARTGGTTLEIVQSMFAIDQKKWTGMKPEEQLEYLFQALEVLANRWKDVGERADATRGLMNKALSTDTGVGRSQAAELAILLKRLEDEATPFARQIETIAAKYNELANLLYSPKEQGKYQPDIKFIEFMAEFSKLATDSIPKAEKLNTQIAMLNEMLKEAEGLEGKEFLKFMGDTTVEDIERTIEHIKTMKGELVEVSETFAEALAPAIQQASLAFTTDFVNALLEGESALDSFKNFSKNIVSQIIAIFLQMAVVNKILNAIFGSTGMFPVEGFDMPTIGGNWFGGKGAGVPAGAGAAGGGGYTGPRPPLTPASNRGSATTFAYASGGATRMNMPTLVGERGPEMFVPYAAGRIMNHADTQSAMGGGGVVVNQSINFSTGIVPTVRVEVMKMLPQIAEVSKAAVLEASLRGGSFRKGLMGNA